MKVLVTGGAGYIGSHTCLALSRNGFVPIVLDSLIRGHESFCRWGRLYNCDISNSKKIQEILIEEDIQIVIHFAGYAYVQESNQKPNSYYENNVLGTLSILNAMKNANVKKIIFSSSCATYGKPHKSPIDENQNQNPINPYGRSKLFSEIILKDFVHAYDFSVVALRYFNAVGADLIEKLGEINPVETRLIPLIIKKCITQQEFTINGSNLNTVDGTCVRDFIHVSDIADAHVKAISALKDKPNFQDFNIGSGKGYSILQIISIVEKVTGKKLKYKFGPTRIGDPEFLVAGNKKASEVLGWIPKVDDIECMIKSAYDWQLLHE